MDVHVVSEGKSGAAAAAIAKVASHPYGIDIPLRCDFEHMQQRPGTKLGCVMQIVHDAAIRVGIEHVFETQPA